MIIYSFSDEWDEEEEEEAEILRLTEDIISMLDEIDHNLHLCDDVLEKIEHHLGIDPVED